MMTKYEKIRISLRYFLLGKEYFLAADALEFASQYHTGTRKDNVTPEFQHQVEITNYLRTLLPSFMYPEETLTTALLHDVSEDYDVPNYLIKARFGDLVGHACNLLNKNGKTSESYFGEISNDPIASLVKGADRINNFQTMVGVFSPEKQKRYLEEGEVYFLPMLKISRRNFVKQEQAYQNIKHMLNSQIELLKRL